MKTFRSNKIHLALITSFLLLGLVILSGCQKTTSKASSSASTQTVKTSQTNDAPKKSTTPTLFFHGYSGTVNSFKGMLQRLEKNQLAKQSLQLTVSPDGMVQATGELNQQAENPMVQVLFTDNVNNEWNQTEWIKNCLAYLQTAYGVEKVNFVGHSMGGVSALRYLATYGQESSSPQVEKFVAIGAPFNDFVDDSAQTLSDELVNGPAVTSSRYQDYQQMIDHVPTQTKVMLIAGQLSQTDLSDGTVPLNSALAVFALLTQHGNQVEEHVVEGDNASHSMLHENQEVDQLVQKFLWEENE
ncbi:alpha/beta fold hydrolase [Candidatus Enterococcus courvalinii]|uniref:Alpha/beta fold hydrolase n=1 Tax=Candidatus Enterococcus courvalinii TaxID=2815329 RepID=A0ABS3HWH5_9ENTE|nr:alpha/beta fold hydrolase [Enterococcus sp. MSG2901]MBO0480817.1 alpha/beta fold hydrolase [Enterococcus sp. MSG2901]